MKEIARDRTFENATGTAGAEEREGIQEWVIRNSNKNA